MSRPGDRINALGNALNDTANMRMARFFIGLFADLGFALVMPLLRRNMGERFFSPFLIILMSAFAIAMCKIMNVNTSYVAWYLVALWAVSAYHLFVIFRRNRKNEPWHTRFEGDFLPIFSFLPKGKSYCFIEGFYEPLFVFIVGSIVQFGIDTGLGALFCFSAAWMVFRSRLRYMEYRTHVMNERDAMIEAQYTMDALNGKPASETRGFVVKGVNSMKSEDKKAIARTMLEPKEFQESYPDTVDFSSLQDNVTTTEENNLANKKKEELPA